MYNRNINRLTAVIQSPIAPRSTNVLWDDLVSNTLKVYRKGIWTVIGGAGGGGEGASLYWGYDEIQGVIFPLEQRSVQINGDLTVNGDITARKLSVAELEIDGKPFEQYWELDTNTNTLSTTYQVIIKNNLIVEQDTSSGGDGQDTPASGIRGIYVNDVPYTDDDGDGFIDLGTISGGGSADLSNYYTKAESDGKYLAQSGGILYNGYSDTPLYSKGDSAGAYIGFMKSTGEFIGYYGFTETTPMVWCGVTESYSLIHSGNIGSQSVSGIRIGEQIRTQEALDAFNDAQNLRFVGVGSILPSPIVASDGIVISIPWYNTTFGAQIAIDDQSNVMLLRTRNQNVWNPWYQFITAKDDGYVYGLGGMIDIQYTDEINRYGGNLHLQHRGGVGATGSGTGGTTTGHILMCANGGNVLIGTMADSGYKLEVNGEIKATKPIFGYMYGTNSNAAAFIFDKPGLNYTGIGSDGVSDTIRLGACNADGTWVDSYAQKWKFYGDVKADKYRLNESDNSFIGTQVGYLSLNSMGNEICIGTNLDDVHINYRPSADGTAPKTYYWRAGSATSWADFYVGTLLAMHQVETYGLYLRDADTAYTQLNMFGLYMWDNIVQFTRRDLNNAYQKALLELNLNNDNAYIYGNLVVSGDVASA